MTNENHISIDDPAKARFLDAVIRQLQQSTGIRATASQKNQAIPVILDCLMRDGVTYEKYLQSIKVDTSREFVELVASFTNHHTYFFREPVQFDYLQQQGLRESVDSAIRAQRKTLRVLSLPCSTGQETYSLAMTCLDFLKSHAVALKLEVHGIDIDEKSVRHAQNGVYNADQLKNVSPATVAKYFRPGTGKIKQFYKVADDVYNICHFENRNILEFVQTNTKSEFDIIFCRNLFIYFSPQQGTEVSEKLNNLLHQGGLFFIGVSETVGQLTGTLVKVGPSIFRKAFQSNAADQRKNNITNKAALGDDSLASLVTSLPPNQKLKKKVLIVDDSNTVQTVLRKIIESDKTLEVVATADHPHKVEKLILEHRPDVITLDIHMPDQNGVELLKAIYPKYRIPTIMITAVSLNDGALVLDALESGAMDYIQKPALSEINQVAPIIIEKIHLAANTRTKRSKQQNRDIKKKTNNRSVNPSAAKAIDMISIGSSTGGTEALATILTKLPSTIPPIVIVQHIPAVFSKAFADRLDKACKFRVFEAKDGDRILANQVLIAPGGFQMSVAKDAKGYFVEVKEAAMVNRHRPSVDVLFNSISKLVGSKAMGIILTGMGQDGAQGLLAMRKSGAKTIGQSEESCVIYGMPKAAAEIGAVETVMDLDEIADVLTIQKLTQQEKNVVGA